jgi:hypothetical protein
MKPISPGTTAVFVTGENAVSRVEAMKSIVAGINTVNGYKRGRGVYAC